MVARGLTSRRGLSEADRVSSPQAVHWKAFTDNISFHYISDGAIDGTPEGDEQIGHRQGLALRDQFDGSDFSLEGSVT